MAFVFAKNYMCIYIYIYTCILAKVNNNLVMCHVLCLTRHVRKNNKKKI